ncbi:hypothetical protein [Frankia sp. Cr2]|uniref:hypothetical protein n=1 Tax=Frankia sp. Cr2 TaxID=3073932 RepID=UPI002AD3010E|nr:hypothetical protein [Frankia sp. Cr2]
MWAAILVGWLSTLLQSRTGIDQCCGRAHGDRLHHEILTVPGRIACHARGLVLRLPPGRDDLLSDAGRVNGVAAT